jgi:hypothetical protein
MATTKLILVKLNVMHVLLVRSVSVSRMNLVLLHVRIAQQARTILWKAKAAVQTVLLDSPSTLTVKLPVLRVYLANKRTPPDLWNALTVPLVGLPNSQAVSLVMPAQLGATLK